MRLIYLVRTEPHPSLPLRATEGSWGFDIRNYHTEIFVPKQVKIVKSGWELAEPLPEDVMLLVLPRSSLFLKYGLIMPNSPGLIDRDYTGDISLLLLNLKDETINIESGTRLGQLMFTHGEKVEFKVVDLITQNHPERGGFGSTGI